MLIASTGPRTADAAGPAPLIGWARVRLWLVATLLWALLRTLSSETAFWVWLVRCGMITAVCVLAYGIFERWPHRLRSRTLRWIVQLVAIVLIMPIATWLSYALTLGTPHVFAMGDSYRDGWLLTTFTGTLFGPWIALVALLRRSEAFAREQGIAFRLRSSELERAALDARLKLLHAQVEPHFLFNTLANIRSLMRQSCPQEADAMLASLIVYLRAAIPVLDAAHFTVGEEEATVRAYLELMQMRMPDRLTCAVTVVPEARAMECPPMAVLTLVENAIKHGIDPNEDGGSVEVRVTVQEQRVRACVVDTGAGLSPSGASGTGTGLANLRERLALVFDGQASMRISPRVPRGTVAEIEFPARARSAP
ncbi:MAG: histidine kinase [Proteobacteria bacterium]|nr:histidine kinase [Pseudomonadota bacterium]